ncbi:hypothetical protein Glove_362g41 [Diversispora epigaea]|uniref:Protein kinase domain-containing protein n=1 Tax=Diversispora epigaea TaxID=1348612 RepID=A0A397H990_9GLOM|nr:hypothetical protein Glove_362g41 [Diversispora epigaea]
MSSLNDNGFIKQFDFKEFTELEGIGKGASGFVIRGNYKKGDQVVALKCVHRNRKSSLIEKEMRSLQQLSYHRNVISFLGISIDHENEMHYLVLEYCENGNLRDYLRINGNLLSWCKKIKMCRDIAHGLRCIHNEGITHRDLHSKNILIHQDSRLVIADFGLSAPLLNETETSSSVCGMLPYIDPQVLDSRYRPKMESDIYSFGMLIWEISSCRVPPFMTIDKLCKMLTQDTPLIISEIIMRCLERLPENRPKIQELVEIFDNLHNPISSPSSLRSPSIGSLSSSSFPCPIPIYTSAIDSPISSPSSNSMYRSALDNDSNTNTSDLSDSPLINTLNHLLNRDSYIAFNNLSVVPPPLPPKTKINDDTYPPPPPIPPKPKRNAYSLYEIPTPPQPGLPSPLQERLPSPLQGRPLSQQELPPQQILMQPPPLQERLPSLSQQEPPPQQILPPSPLQERPPSPLQSQTSTLYREPPPQLILPPPPLQERPPSPLQERPPSPLQQRPPSPPQSQTSTLYQEPPPSSQLSHEYVRCAYQSNMFCENENEKLIIKDTDKNIEGTFLELRARYGKPDAVKESFTNSLQFEVNSSHFLHLIINNDNFNGKKEFKSIVKWLYEFGFLENMINELVSLEPLSSLELLSPKVSPLFALCCIKNTVNLNHVQYLLQSGADPNLLSEPFKLSILNLILLRMINDEEEDYSSIIEDLLDHDADPNIPLDISNIQYSQFFIKSKQHNTSVCPKVPNSLYLSLHLSDRYRKKVIGLLLDKVVITQEDHLGTNILEYAVKEKLYPGIIDLLNLLKGEKLHERVARQLVQIEQRDDIYQNIIGSILYEIMEQTEFPQTIKLIKLMELLLKFGANPNLPIKSSNHWDDLPNSLFACVHLEGMEPSNFAYLIKILIETKANYEEKYKDFNVLHYALLLRKFEAFKNIVKALPENDECLSQGINRTYTLTPLNRFLLEITQCNLGTTPLAVETVKLLLKKGANANLFVRSARGQNDKEIYPDFPNTLFLAIYLQDKIDQDIILLLIYLGRINFATKTITTINAFKNLNILQYTLALRDENIELLKFLMENVVEFNQGDLIKSISNNSKVRSWLKDHKRKDTFNIENQERKTKGRLGITA